MTLIPQETPIVSGYRRIGPREFRIKYVEREGDGRLVRMNSDASFSIMTLDEFKSFKDWVDALYDQMAEEEAHVGD